MSIVVKRVLVVDDENDITESLKIGLERHGFRVDAYNDPIEAVSHFQPGAYDVVLLDIGMPKMNGFEVYRKLTEIDNAAKICFLAAFDTYRDEFDRMFPDLNVRCFLRKPISISELAKRLKEWTGGQK